MSKKYKYRNKKASRRDWQQLSEDAQLREAYTRFASSVQTAQQLAEARSPQVGKPASHIIDLREAGRILEQHPQLMSFIIGVQERMLAESSARALPNEMLSTKASPTGMNSQAASLGGWAGYVDKNQPQGVPNARTLRDWADNDEWVNSAITYYCDRVGRADVAITPLDERLPYNRPTEKSVQLVLDQPNELGDTWPSLLRMGIRDFFTLGRLTFSKSMSTKRQPTALYAEDAAMMRVYPAWSGDPNEPRWLFTNDDGRTKIPLRNDEVIGIFDNLATFRYSYSRVQALRNTIIADLKASESAARMVDQKPPPHVIQIPGANEQQIRTLRATYESSLQGRQEVMFLGGANAAQVKPLVYSLKDQQWMEWMEYLVRKIAVTFGLSLTHFSYTDSVNKATASSQQDIAEDKGLIPFMLLLEEHMNRQFIADFAPRLSNGRTNIQALNLRLMFPEISEAARMLHVEKAIGLATQSLAGLPSQTINQILAMLGQESIPGGNALYVMTANGPMPWLSYDQDMSGSYFGPDGMPRGTQDADGGPSVDDTSDDDISGKQEEAAENKVTETTSANDASGTPSSDTNEDNGAQKSYVDNRKPGITWKPYMMSPTITKAKPPSKPLPEETQERKQLIATVTRIFQDRARQAAKDLEGLR